MLRMELALNIVGLLVCLGLALVVVRSVTKHGRSYFACFAMLLVCVSLIFPAISMTDDLAMGVLLPQDPSLPQLKMWQSVLQLALFSTLLVAPIVVSIGKSDLDSVFALAIRSACSGYQTANSLRAPPAALA